MDLEIKIEVALEILNSLIADFSATDTNENEAYLQKLLIERAQVQNQDEEVIDRVISVYGPIVKEEVTN